MLLLIVQLQFRRELYNMTGFRDIVTKYLGLSTHYDSDLGYGAGITLSY